MLQKLRKRLCCAGGCKHVHKAGQTLANCAKDSDRVTLLSILLKAYRIVRRLPGLCWHLLPHIEGRLVDVHDALVI